MNEIDATSCQKSLNKLFINYREKHNRKYKAPLQQYKMENKSFKVNNIASKEQMQPAA